MIPYESEIIKIRKEIIEKYNPQNIILFGSLAKGFAHKASDIDICVIIETEDKRKLSQDMLLNIKSDIELEIVVYTPEEWKKNKDDLSTFAGIINKTGVSLIG